MADEVVGEQAESRLRVRVHELLYRGWDHIRYLKVPGGQLDACLAAGGDLAPGSVLPEKWDGPPTANVTVLSPMLQHVERASQQAGGGMQEVVAHYIELEAQS